MSHPAHGRFVWYDLMTTDQPAAKAFYNQIIGWGTRRWEGSEMAYTMWTRGDEPIGGIMALPKEAGDAGVPPHWIAYVAVTDVGATCERATTIGGSVLHAPMDIEGAGCFAILRDPQGAVFAVYTSENLSTDAPEPPEIGQFSWHELATTVVRDGYDFYTDLFGWETKQNMDMGEGWIYRIFGQDGGFPLGGMFTKPDEMAGPPMWLYYISVPSVDDTVARVKELGGKVLSGPIDVPGGGKIAQCLDPQGASFALHSSPATAEASGMVSK